MRWMWSLSWPARSVTKTPDYHAAILAIAPDSHAEPDGSTTTLEIAARRGWLYDVLNGTQHQPLIEMSGGPYWPGGDGKP